MEGKFVEYLITSGLKKSSIVKYSDQAPKFIFKLTRIDLFSVISLYNLQVLKSKLEQIEEFIAVDANGNRMYSAALNHYERFLEYLNGQDELEKYQISLQEQVILSISKNQAQRLERLKSAPSKPELVPMMTKVFKRNPDVVAEALYRAKGKCEECGNEAPFNRSSDGSPYLEVHHKIMLKDGGGDTLDNTQALCPNCHRKKHFG